MLAAVCLGCTERDSRVRIEDPVAPRLISWRDGKFAAVRLTALHPVLRRLQERMIPGGYGYIVARVHHMDAIIRQELARGLDRIIILGAGYDTRAYRMAGLLEGVQVFEVDLPAISRAKRARLQKALGSLPGTVTYVEADFTRHELLEKLAQHGHDVSARTLFVLSGVALFLPEAAVSDLFAQVSAHSSARTSVLFDYVFQDILTTPGRYYGGRELVRFATRVGEAPRSGIPPGELAARLADHGLRLDSQLDPAGLAARYLRRTDGTSVSRPYGFSGIAHAFVGAQSGFVTSS